MVRNIRIDAAALCDKNLSGVGQVTLETIRALADDDDFMANHRLNLIVTRKDSHMLVRHQLDKRIRVQRILLPTKVWSGLNRFNVVPWADLLFGGGVYIFPNFRNWRLLRAKSITYIHDIAFIKYPETVSPRNLAYLNKNVRSWLKRTDQVVTVSESSRDEIVEHFKLSRTFVTVVPNAVNKDIFYKRPKQEIDRVKAKVGVKKDYVLFVGNIEPRKNLTNLIQAFSDMPQKLLSETELMLVGAGGWLNDDVTTALTAAEAKGAHVIRPSSFVHNDELACLYSGTSLAVLPSIHEGFGMPVLEALACGARVAASDLPVIREVGGDAIAYFNPHDVSDMTRVLSKEIKAPKPKAGLVRHNWSDSVKQLEAIVSRLEAHS